MLNVIRMEIMRMFKTRSFYITIAIGVIFAGLMLVSLTPSMNKFYDGISDEINETLYQSENAEAYISMEIAYSDTACPSNICGSFVAVASMFISIFAACFVGEFYKNGFCKNVINTVKHRYYFQVARAICMIIYAAIILAINTIVTCGLAATLVHRFEFTYMKDFALYLLGEYCLTAVMGIAAAFFTELFRSKIPAIVYVVLSTSSLMVTIISAIDSKLGQLLSTEVYIEDYLVSTYQLNFYGDLPMENNAVIHALVLSFAFFVVYNILGSILVTKRDI